MGTLRARKFRAEVYGAQTALATPEGRTHYVVKVAKKIKELIIYRDVVHADERRKRYQDLKGTSKPGAIHHRQESNEKSRKKALWCINRERLRIKRKELKKRHKRAEG